MAFFMADHHHRLVVETREAAHDGVVIGKVAVAGQGRVFGKERLDIVLAVRTFRVTGDLAFAPGRQLFVEILEQGAGLGVERAGFVLDIHLVVLARHGAEFFSFAFDLGQRFFKIEIVRHGQQSPCCLRLAVYMAVRARICNEIGLRSRSPGSGRPPRGRPSPS